MSGSKSAHPPWPPPSVRKAEFHCVVLELLAPKKQLAVAFGDIFYKTQ